MIAAIGSRSPMMVKAQVSPGLRAKTKPQIEQRSRSDQPEKSRPLPQCGQRLRSPRQSAVRINFEREGVSLALIVFSSEPSAYCLLIAAPDAPATRRGAGT